MTTNTMKKAAGASNTNGPHTDTNGANSPTDGASNQAHEGMTNNVEQAFLAAIEAAGLPPPYEIIADGQIHRFSSNGKVDDRTGWYILRGDGVAAGAFGCWREGITHHWRSKSTSAMTQTERVAYRDCVQSLKALRDSEQTKRNASAAAKATKWFDAEPLCTSHPYLTTKGVQPYDIRQSGDRLLIPLYDSTGVLHSLQTITPGGDKRFLTGGRVKGCFHSITGPDGVLLICEGYATGASLHEATGHAVAVAFNAGNLETVAIDLHAQYPDVKIVIAADDDDQTKGNPGMTKARAAAAAVGGYLAVPDFGANRPAKATDFNDLHQHSGLDAVKSCIDDALRSIPATAGNAMLTGQFVAPIGVPNAASLSEDMQRLRAAIAAIPVTAFLKNHTAEEVIGMALRHVSSGIDEDLGKALCGEWDGVTGGAALAVFDTSDPNYSATKPLGLPSVYSLARMYGWSDSEPWPAPTPLPDALPPVMAFNEDLLPAALRPWVIDIAHRMQCPADFPAVTVLVAMSSLIGARAVVQPKALDSWQVVPNLWGVVVGRPGVKKSPALGEALKPLHKLQENESDAWQLANAAWELDCKVAEMQSEANERKAKSLATTDPVAARALLVPVVTPAEPLARRYVVNDATVEKLGELMQQNPWGILSYRDELYGLLTGMDKPGQEGARAFMLQSYDGNQGYTFDRIGRGTVHIPRVCLAMIGGIQPSRIQEYVRGAVTGGSADDGLLQRFGLAVWPDIANDFIHVDRQPDTKAKQTAVAAFDRLAGLQPANETEPVVWRFDDAAQALFVAWLVPFEVEIRGDVLHPAMVSHLAKYRKLIPALALLFALIDTPDSGGVIHEAELIRALAMGDYLRSHANRLYAAATTPETKGAEILLSKIKAGKLVGSDGVIYSRFTPRQVAMKNWSGLGSPADARKAAELLVDYDYLRREAEPTGASGGRPSERYAINPAVLKDIAVGTSLHC
jgi:phage/plasmid primase-like uncharacterized protein